WRSRVTARPRLCHSTGASITTTPSCTRTSRNDVSPRSNGSAEIEARTRASRRRSSALGRLLRSALRRANRNQRITSRRLAHSIARAAVRKADLNGLRIVFNIAHPRLGVGRRTAREVVVPCALDVETSHSPAASRDASHQFGQVVLADLAAELLE